MSIEDGPGDTLNPSESLDPDDVKNADGDDVMDAPDQWSEADRFGTTPREEIEGEPLETRVAEEEPEVALEEQPEIPVAVAPDDKLSEDLVDKVVDERGPTAD